MSRKRLIQLEPSLIKDLVQRSGYNISALANKIGIGRSTLNHWISDCRLPVEGIEALLVHAAFPNANIRKEIPDTTLGKEIFIPDYTVTPPNSTSNLKVEVKIERPKDAHIEKLQGLGIDKLVYLDKNKLKVHEIGSSHPSNLPEDQLDPHANKEMGVPHGFLKHSFALRPNEGSAATLVLPIDLTEREAERLYLYIKSLVVNDNSDSASKRGAKRRRG